MKATQNRQSGSGPTSHQQRSAPTAQTQHSAHSVWRLPCQKWTVTFTAHSQVDWSHRLCCSGPQRSGQAVTWGWPAATGRWCTLCWSGPPSTARKMGTRRVIWCCLLGCPLTSPTSSTRCRFVRLVSRWIGAGTVTWNLAYCSINIVYFIKTVQTCLTLDWCWYSDCWSMAYCSIQSIDS